MVRHRPTDDATAVDIEDDGKIEKAHPCRDIRDVRHPQLIRGGSREVALDEVGGGCGIRPAAGGARPLAPMAPLQPGEAEQTCDPLARAIHSFIAQLGPDAGHPIGTTTAPMDDANPLAQRMVGMRTGRRRSRAPRVVAALWTRRADGTSWQPESSPSPPR